MSDLRNWIGGVLLIIGFVFGSTPAHSQTLTLEQVREMIYQACPKAWEDLYSQIQYQTDTPVWVDDISDAAQFVHYASLYLKAVDGSFTIESYSKPDGVIYECSGLRMYLYEESKAQAQALQTSINNQSHLDSDGDGVNDAVDLCADTANGATINVQGCSQDQIDSDGDGVFNPDDVCPNTPAGEPVNFEGCALSSLDSDNDGVNDLLDQCPGTPTGNHTGLDANGCIPDQIDTDSDGTPDYQDAYPLQNGTQCPFQ